MEHSDSSIIDALGGNAKVAKHLDISSQAVSKWRREGIPKPRLMYLRLAFPDVDWAYLRGTVAVDAEKTAKTEPPKEAA